MRGTTTFVPAKGCGHAYGMLFEDDFCCCKKCNQRWVMTERGWRAVPASWDDGQDTDDRPTATDPYRRYRAPAGAKLKPKIRVKK